MTLSKKEVSKYIGELYIQVGHEKRCHPTIPDLRCRLSYSTRGLTTRTALPSFAHCRNHPST